MQEGQALEHATYGSGVVLSSDEERTVVEFHNFGRKLFVTEMMSAKLVGGSATALAPISLAAPAGEEKDDSECRRLRRRQRPCRSLVDDVPKYLVNAAGRRRLSRATLVKLSEALSAERLALQRRDDIFAEELYSTLRLIIWDRFRPSLEELQRIEESQFLHFKAAPEVGKRIRRFREQRRMLRSELHRRSGIPLTSLEYYERGARKPSVSVLEKMSSVLGVKIDRFLDGQAQLQSTAIRILLPIAERLGWMRWRSLLGLMAASAQLPPASPWRKREAVTLTKRDLTSKDRDHYFKKA